MSLINTIIMIWAVVSFFAAIHASGQDKTFLWGFVVFFTGIFGLIFYAISLASD